VGEDSGGNDEKKERNSEDESPQSSDLSEGEGEDEPDSDSEVVALGNIIPAGFKLQTIVPQINQNLVGRKFMMCWDPVGWTLGTVSRFYENRKRYDIEVRYDNGNRFDHKLCINLFVSSLENLSGAAGSWTVLQ